MTPGLGAVEHKHKKGYVYEKHATRQILQKWNSSHVSNINMAKLTKSPPVAITTECYAYVSVLISVEFFLPQSCIFISAGGTH